MMNRIIYYSAILLWSVCFLAACKKEVRLNPNDLVDARDGTRYSTVVIGNQRWMAENLQYDGVNSWYNPNNPFSEYGRLYTYEEALNACPPGWHLPSEQDWYQLERILEVGAADLSSVGYRGGSVGLRLKSSTGWLINNGSNSLLFNAYPAGVYEYQNQTFASLGEEAGFWTATTNGSNANRAWYRGLTKNFNGIYRETKDVRDGLSCRCIEDE